jgi:hypothetical protein
MTVLKRIRGEASGSKRHLWNFKFQMSHKWNFWEQMEVSQDLYILYGGFEKICLSRVDRTLDARLFLKKYWYLDKQININKHSRSCRICKSFASYSERARIESRLWHRLSWLRYFVNFLSHSRKICGIVPRLGHYRFLPDPFQIIIHLSFILWRYVVELWRRR